MNITNHSPQRLELEHRPTHWIIGLGLICAALLLFALKALFDGEWTGVAIAGAMLAGVGWVWLTQVFLTVRLSAEQDGDRLKITTISLFGEKFRERELADLTGAEVETRYSETSSTREAGLVLKFGSERHPISLFKPDPADLLQAAESINAWLKQTRAH
ncbi:MAG: hypothetical protein RQ729_12800, partial [Wenzhouxiangellaceae bacterium]|nr:hypothetical protein [Wenzhouxiangellaceae bacterium]